MQGNHTGYRRFTGTRTSAEELTQLYSGLKASYLTDFDVLLSGYIPSVNLFSSCSPSPRTANPQHLDSPQIHPLYASLTFVLS